MSALVVLTAVMLSQDAGSAEAFPTEPLPPEAVFPDPAEADAGTPPPADAGEPPPSGPWDETDPEPYGQPDAHAVHLYAGAALGTCRRDHTDVPAIGPCGELSIGVEHRLNEHLTSHFDLDVGFFPASRSGDASYGVERRSGSPFFLAARYAFGIDFTSRFFLRAGPQLRVAFAFNRPVPGVQAVFDLGTRIWRLETGFRLNAGVDGVAQTGPNDGWPHWTAAPCIGVLVFLRFRIA